MQLRLAPERLAKVVIKIGKEPQVRGDGFQVAQLKPLLAKVSHQVCAAWISQHPANLVFQHLRLVQLTPLGRPEQFFVRNTAPKKEGEPRSQSQIAHPINRVGRKSGRVLLNPEQKFRAY